MVSRYRTNLSYGFTNKNITQIRYNYQNLPTEINFANNQKISYIYSADGTKLQKQVQYTNYTVTTDYIGGYQYETKPVEQGGLEHPQLLFFPTAEGYVKAIYKMDPIETEPRGYQYVYIYKDHLGNNRLSYTLDPETEQVKILEENHYYPFGLKHNAYVPTKKDVKYQELAINEKEIKQVQPAEVVYKYKYQSQERQDELNLNWDSFKYRNYDYAIGRFMSIDPLADDYPYNSTYAFSENRVIDGVELEGTERLSVHTPGWFFSSSSTIRNNHPTEAQIKSATAGVLLSHPIASYKVGKVERGGTNISSIAGRISRHAAEGGNMTVGLGSQRNALRHVIWSGSIANKFGEGIAQRIGNAHEGIPISAQKNAHVDFKQPPPDNIGGADSVVDFLNNQIGRDIGKKFGKNASEWDIAIKALEIQFTQGLWTATTDSNGNIVISRTKISKEQYQTALNRLHRLDKDGMNDEDRKNLKSE